MARKLSGTCLCGAVQYEVADEFAYAANCHCSNCRRATGSAFKPFAGIERDKLTLVKGVDLLLIYGDQGGHDVHGRLCGSLLYSLVRDGTFSMSPWEPSSTIRPLARRPTSSWVPRRAGSPSPTTFRNIKST